MTPQLALEIATKAHKGQFRKPIEITQTDVDNLVISHHYEHNCITSDGSKFYEQDGKYFLSKPYVSHPIAVAAMMTTDEEKVVALLHDVIEDTEWTLYPWDGLWLKLGNTKYELSYYIYTALHKITKWEIDGKDYTVYIHDVSKDRLTTKVKLADMFHNMSDAPSEKQKAKYLKAIPILLNSL